MARADIESHSRRVMKAEQQLCRKSQSGPRLLASPPVSRPRGAVRQAIARPRSRGRAILPADLVAIARAKLGRNRRVAAAFAWSRAAMQSEADESRAVALGPPPKPPRYARASVEGASRTRCSADRRPRSTARRPTHSAALDLVSCAANPRAGALFAAPAPAPSFAETPVVATASSAPITERRRNQQRTSRPTTLVVAVPVAVARSRVAA